MYKQKHILVIDDDKKLGRLLKSFLTEKGYLVDFVENTLIAKEKLFNIVFDLLILDVMLPKESGLSFASKLRTTNDTPILMLSAMSAPRDRIKGLKTGVDEYLAKPFEPEELLLRIENVIRRSQSIQQEINIIKIGFFSFDVNKNILSKKNASIKLTVKEAKVLLHLYKNLGKLICHNQFQIARQLLLQFHF